MGDKKRKNLTSGSELPEKKKTKKHSKHAPTDEDAGPDSVPSNKSEDVTTTLQPTVAADAPPSGSKQSRKRAADFLSDHEDEEAPPALSSKDPQAVAGAQQTSSKGSKKRKAKKAKREAEAAAATPLTTSGVNGVTKENKKSKVKADTTKSPTAQSMRAEARLTNDEELEDEWGSFTPDDKAHEKKDLTSETKIGTDNNDEDGNEENEAALLVGFDSDTSDVEDQGWNGNLPDVPLNNSGHSKLQKVKSKDPETEPGTMYIGRLPHGFYENEMRAYFGQFGEITELRLARNKRTGASKHFAFIEFASSKVCKIAVETMNAYLLYGHILKCNFIPQEDVPAGLWKGSNRKFRKIPHVKIEREKLAAPKSVEQWEKKNAKEQRKREKKAKKLKEVMDYDAPASKLKDPRDAVEQARLLAQKIGQQAANQDEGVQDEKEIKPVAAIEVPDQLAGATKTPDQDEVQTKKNKGAKKDAATTEGVDNEPTEPAAATDAIIQAEAVTEEFDQDEGKSKKKKKKAKKESVVAEGAEAPANEPTTAIDGPAHTEAASEGLGKDEVKSKKKSKKEVMTGEPADDGAQEAAPAIKAPKEVAPIAEVAAQGEEKPPKKKKNKGKKDAATLEANGDEVRESAPLPEISKETEAIAEGDVQDEGQDEGKRKKKEKKSKKGKAKVETPEASEAALPTAKDSIPKAKNESAAPSAEKPAETAAINGEAQEGEQPSKETKKRKMGKGKKEKGALINGTADRLMTDINQKEGLVSATTPDARVAIASKTNPPTPAGDLNNKRREKYVPPTHRKMQARAEFAQNNSELHRAQQNAKKAQERAERRTRKEEKARKRYEKRKQRREQSENDKAKAAAAKRAPKAEASE